MAIVFDGKRFAQEKEKKLKAEIKKLKIKPKLVVILVGDDPASLIYVRKKKEAAKRVGIEFELKKFAKNATEALIISYIKEKNADKNTSGIMVQLPLPKNLDEMKIRKAIHPFKDVDCLHPKNLGILMMGKPVFCPATVRAVLEILFAVPPPRSAFAHLAGVTTTSQGDISDGDPTCPPTAAPPGAGRREGLLRGGGIGVLSGKEVVIVGASNLVGKPLAMVLSNLGATVTICRSKTINLGKHTKRAEILITATGKTGLIKKNMVRKGTVVIDVGETKGDVDKDVSQVASFITPVPGGVGPVTVVSLFENVVKKELA